MKLIIFFNKKQGLPRKFVKKSNINKCVFLTESPEFSAR